MVRFGGVDDGNAQKVLAANEIDLKEAARVPVDVIDECARDRGEVV